MKREKIFTFGPKTKAMVTVVLICVRTKPNKYFMSGPTFGNKSKLKFQIKWFSSINRIPIGIDVNYWNEAKMILVTAML